MLGGQYRIEYEIGHGGFGTVYRAKQLAVDRDVAVKVLELPMGLRREHHAMLVARFRREAKATSALKHPNTVTLIDFGEDETGVLFLVLELLEGLDLKSLNIGEAPLASSRVAHIATQICGSLSDAHSRGFVHRDLKPANVFISNFQGAQDFAKVLDFGIARMLDPGDESEVTEITMEGMRIGTPRYMPPEQLRGEPVGPPTDLYALGCIIYEMLTGKKVFEGPGTVQNAIAHASAPVPRVEMSSLTSDQTDHWNCVLARLLAKRSQTRVQTADEVAALLKPLLQENPGPLPDIATMSIMVEDIVENETPVVPPPTPGPPPVPGTAEASFGLDTTDVAPAASADSVPQGKTGSSAWITGALVVVAMLLAGILLTQNDTPSTPQESGQPAPPASDGDETIGEHHATLAAALERLDEPATPTACKTSDPALAKTLVRAAALLESGEPIAAVTVLETDSGGTDLSAERWSLMARARLAHSVKVSRTIPGKSSDAKSCETALENAARASELCPAMAAPHMTRGRVHAHRATLTEIPQATAAYEEAIARLGDQPTYKGAALFNQSRLWIRSDPERAEKRLDELLTLLPDYKGARWLRGEAKLGRARLAKEPNRAELARSAVTDLEQAKAKHPGEAGVLFLLGTGQELAGERDRARGSFCELAELGTDRIHMGAKKKCASLSLKSP